MNVTANELTLMQKKEIRESQIQYISDTTKTCYVNVGLLYLLFKAHILT